MEITWTNGKWIISKLLEKSAWYLDKGRKHPILKITRFQLPLAPAFAMTFHASQGQTFKKGTIVDMRIGKDTNPIGSYVAMTRVEKREDMLIYRPFDRALFTRGPLKGPALLLKQLRGEYIDWHAIEEEYMPRKRCVGCNFVQYKECLQPQQWSKKDKRPFCKTCVEGKVREGTPFQCTNCGLFLGKQSFSGPHQHANAINTRVCNDCVERRSCCECGVAQEEDNFTSGEWKHARWTGSKRGTCRKCQKCFRSEKPCSKCEFSFGRLGFCQKQWDKSDAERKCMQCIKWKMEEKRCSHCKKMLPRSGFSQKQWDKSDAEHKCTQCIKWKMEEKICSHCKKMLPRSGYITDKMWFANDSARKCKSCVVRKHGYWPCIGCKACKAIKEFSKWSAHRAQKRNNETARCNACMRAAEEQESIVCRKTIAKIVKH